MIPGEYMLEVVCNAASEGREVVLEAANTGDRPIQVGSHYHFYEVNPALVFEREKARGMRLDIPAGTAVRLEPGQKREVRLFPHGGVRPHAGASTAFGGR